MLPPASSAAATGLVTGPTGLVTGLVMGLVAGRQPVWLTREDGSADVTAGATAGATVDGSGVACEVLDSLVATELPSSRIQPVGV